jgi:hypothetical protein
MLWLSSVRCELPLEKLKVAGPLAPKPRGVAPRKPSVMNFLGRLGLELLVVDAN